MNLHDLPLPMPSANDDEAFSEPWQAQAFAMTVALHQSGLFSWKEWTDGLSAALHAAHTGEDGSDYYDCWVSALENLLCDKGIAASHEVDALAAAWQRAAHATPHGKPVLLANDPQAGDG